MRSSMRAHLLLCLADMGLANRDVSGAPHLPTLESPGCRSATVCVAAAAAAAAGIAGIVGGAHWMAIAAYATVQHSSAPAAAAAAAAAPCWASRQQLGCTDEPVTTAHPKDLKQLSEKKNVRSRPKINCPCPRTSSLQASQSPRRRRPKPANHSPLSLPLTQ